MLEKIYREREREGGGRGRVEEYYWYKVSDLWVEGEGEG